MAFNFHRAAQFRKMEELPGLAATTIERTHSESICAMRIANIQSLIIALTASLAASRADAQRISSVADLRDAIAGARSGARLSVPAGTFDIGATPLRIDGTRNVSIVGAGAGKTIIRASASAPYIFELAGSNDNLEVAGMTLEGAARLRKNTHALASGPDRMNLTRARFHDLVIRNVAVGISVAGTGNGICDDVRISSNRLDNIQDVVTPEGTTSGSGYGIHNEGCSNVTISHNTIRNADRHSIYQASAYQPDRPRASGSIIIENNVIIDHGRTSSLPNEWQVALVVARSSNVVVSGNEIINPYHDAMSIEDAPEEGRALVIRNISLIDNVVRDGHAADLFLTASGTFTSRGNRYYHGDVIQRPTIRRNGRGVSGRLSPES